MLRVRMGLLASSLGVAAGGLALAAFACSPSPAPPAASEGQRRVMSVPAATAAIDLAAVRDRVAHRFVRTGDGVASHDSAYELSISAGRVDFRPAVPDAPALALGAIRVVGDAPAPEASRPLAIEGSVARWGVSRRVEARVEARRGEAELSFEVAQPPPGALEVRLPVSGLALRGRTDLGLHFGAPAGGPGVRVGHVTVVDARGARRSLDSRFERGEIRLFVPASLLAEAAYPVVIDPVVSPEIDPGVLLYVGASGGQQFPATAFDGTNFLVVWVDTRHAGASRIWGARVTPLGAVLDPIGFQVSDEVAGPDSDPALACDGTVCLVVWQRRMSIADKIYAARVTPAGGVLDSTSFPLVSGASEQTSFTHTEPAVALNGSSFLVVWVDVRGAFWTVKGGRVQPDGTQLEPSGFDICINGIASPTRPAVVSTGAMALVVWEDSRTSATGIDVWGALVEANQGQTRAMGLGLLSGSLGSGLTGNQDQPSVGAAGSGFFVAWRDRSRGGVFGARVEVKDWGPQAIETAGINLGLTTEDEARPAVGSDGTDFGVAWDSFRMSGVQRTKIVAAKVSAATGTVTPFTSAGEILMAAPSVAFGAGEYLVVGQTSGVNVVGFLADAGLDPTTATFVVATGAAREDAPAVSFDGANYLVAWREWRPAPSIVASFVSPDGTVRDPAGILLATLSQDTSPPALGFDGSSHVAVWMPVYGPLTARAVAPDGTLGAVATLSTTSGSNGGLPGMACLSGQCLVAWQDDLTTPSLRAQRITTANLQIASLDPGTPPGGIEVEPDGFEPVVAASGSGYLLAWRTAGNDIGAAHLASSTWSVLDTPRLVVSAEVYRESAPTVSWDGTSYLVAWLGPTAALGTQSVRARQLPAASGLGSFVPFDLPLAGVSLAAAFDGTHHVLAYEAVQGTTREIRAARVTPSGAFADEILVSPGDSQAPALARGPGEQMLLAYHTNVDGPPFGTTSHVFARLWAPCSTAQECDDGDPCTADACDVTAGGCAHAQHACAPGPCEIDSVCDGVGGCAVTPKPDDNPCADDGLSCTADLCRTGACEHALAAAWCLIGGTCVAEDAANPARECERCAPASSTTGWTATPACADAGLPDAGMPDASTIGDGGLEDGSVASDSGAVVDAGPASDAGAADDAGLANDAGVVSDAGGGDSGAPVPDAGGSGADGGGNAGRDAAGAEIDGGGAPPDGASSSGCGCGAAKGGGAPAWGLAAVIGWRGQRRRRGAPPREVDEGLAS